MLVLLCLFFFWWMVYELLFMNHLSILYFFRMWAIFFFFFFFLFDMLCGHVAYLLWVCIFSLFFFDMPCGHVAYLLWVCIFFFVTCSVSMWYTFFGYASFISFCIAHIPDGNFGEREGYGMTWSFYFVVDGSACYLPV